MINRRRSVNAIEYLRIFAKAYRVNVKIANTKIPTAQRMASVNDNLEAFGILKHRPDRRCTALDPRVVIEQPNLPTRHCIVGDARRGVDPLSWTVKAVGFRRH